MNKPMLIILCIILSCIVNSSSSQITTTDKSEQVIKRSPEWIVELQKNFDNPQWFYDNLNDTERSMIRQALDMAIPRGYIADNYFGGLKFLIPNVPLTQVHGKYYNSSIPVTQEDFDTAYYMLASIFGYEYNLNGYDDPNTPYSETKPYFPISLDVYNSYGYLDRAGYIGVIADYWMYLGVAVKIVPLLPVDVYDRIHLSSQGWDYAHGGLDSFAVAWSTSPMPMIYTKYNSKNYNFDNILYLNNSYIDSLLDIYIHTSNETQRLQAIYDFQDFYHKNTIKSMIGINEKKFLLNKDLEGFNPYLITNYNNLTHPTKNFITYAPYGDTFYNFNPLLSAYYQGLETGGIFGTSGYPTAYGGLKSAGALAVTTDSNSSLVVKNYLAKGYSVTSDQLHWTVNLHSGLLWHDGYPLNASDLKFTFDSWLNKSLDPRAFYVSQLTMYDFLGDASNIVIENETAVTFNLKLPNPLFYMNLMSPLLPKHILGSVDVSQWVDHYTNFPNQTYGPIGYGPYKFKSYTHYANANNTLILEKWDNNTAITGEKVPTINEIHVVDYLNINPIDFLDLVENNTVDIVQINYRINRLDQFKVHDFLQTTNNTKNVSLLGTNFQELGYQQGSPIWGMNPIDPSIYPVPPVVGNQTNNITSWQTTTVFDTSTFATSSTGTQSASFGDPIFVVGGLLIFAIVLVMRRKKKE